MGGGMSREKVGGLGAMTSKDTAPGRADGKQAPAAVFSGLATGASLQPVALQNAGDVRRWRGVRCGGRVVCTLRQNRAHHSARGGNREREAYAMRGVRL